MNMLPDTEPPQWFLPINLKLQTACQLEYLATKANMPPKLYAEVLLEATLKNIYELSGSTSSIEKATQHVP